jgi:hypothetical protein
MPHEFEMPQKHIDAMTARMGREHSQETFETEKTALVVVDMQNYFMDESQQAGCPVGQTVVGNVNRIAETVRRTGGIVIWIQNLSPADTKESWKTAHERYLPEKSRAPRRIDDTGCLAIRALAGARCSGRRLPRHQAALQCLHPGLIRYRVDPEG